MDCEELKRIDDHFPSLVASTGDIEALVGIFEERGILTYRDTLVIGSKKVAAGKTAEFYRLIRNRENAYPVLIQALLRMGQYDAIQILAHGEVPPDVEERVKQLVRNSPFRDDDDDDKEEGSGQPHSPQAQAPPQPSPSASAIPQEQEFQVSGAPGAEVGEDPGDETGTDNEPLTQEEYDRFRKLITISEAGSPEEGLEGSRSCDGVLEGPLTTRSRSSSDPAEEEETGHPLLIKKVLENLFKHIVFQPTTGPEEVVLKHTQIQNLRLVCKKWRNLVTPLYRPTLGPQNLGEAPESPSTDDIDNSNFKLRQLACFQMMQTFLDTMRHSQMIPVQSYEIHENVITQGSEKMMKDFLRLCGPEAVSLRFFVEDEFTERYLLRSLPELNLTKLRKLEVTLADSELETIPRWAHGLAEFIGLLLNGAVSLLDFKFELDRLRNWHNSRQMIIMHQIEEVIRVKLPQTVTSLCLNMYLHHDPFFKTLMEKSLQLKEFECTSHSILGGETTRNFLLSQAPTLLILRIKKIKSKLLEFPRLPKLELLELHDTDWIEGFSFTETFPKLSYLNIAIWDNDEVDSFMRLFSFADEPVLTLREVRLPRWVDLCYPEKKMTEMVEKCFPNALQTYYT